MRTFGSLNLALAVLSSFIIFTSATPVDIPPPPPPTDIANLTGPTPTLSADAFPTPVIPFIYNSDFTPLDKRQESTETPESDWEGACIRVNVGKHNCPLMNKACHMFFEANWPPGDMKRANEGERCKRYVCAQTLGDCFHLYCSWC